LEIVLNTDLHLFRTSFEVQLKGDHPTASQEVLPCMATPSLFIHVNAMTSRYGFNGGQILYVFETLNALTKIADGFYCKGIWSRKMGDVKHMNWIEQGKVKGVCNTRLQVAMGCIE
jgi:hypothetical protein